MDLLSPSLKNSIFLLKIFLKVKLPQKHVYELEYKLIIPTSLFWNENIQNKEMKTYAKIP
jgi:hypothetical protein